MLTFGDKSSLSAYVIFAALRDSQKLDYNSKVKAGIGVELKHRLSKAVRLSFGAKWDNEYRIYSGTTYSAPVATADLSIYKSWRPDWLRNGPASDAKLVLSGWANIRFPAALEPSERDNVLAQGVFKLGMIFPLAKTGLKIAPFASIGVKADSKGRAFNNKIEPAVGLDLKIPIGRRGELVAGIKITQQTRFHSGQTQVGTIGFLSWYKNF